MEGSRSYSYLEITPKYWILINIKQTLLYSGDGVANPNEICLALGNEAMAGGVKVLENCEVNLEN